MLRRQRVSQKDRKSRRYGKGQSEDVERGGKLQKERETGGGEQRRSPR